MLENQEAYKNEEKRVETKMGFYILPAVCVGVDIPLINLANFASMPLAQMAVIGWR